MKSGLIKHVASDCQPCECKAEALSVDEPIKNLAVIHRGFNELPLPHTLNHLSRSVFIQQTPLNVRMAHISVIYGL